MKTKMHRWMTLLLGCIMLVGLLPPTSLAAAAESRKVISKVRGSASTATYPPKFGNKAVKPYIQIFEGSPAGYNTPNGNWYRKNADSTETKLEESDIFTEGTYYFRCKVQISAPDGTEYVLNKDGITADVNGVNWATDGDVTITDRSSYVWVNSPDCVVKSPYKNIEMSFEPNGGSGTQAPVSTDQYGNITMPQCTFTKKGDRFFAWNVGGALYFPNDPCNITQNTTATAVWKSETAKDIAITMTPISEGKTPAEIVFDCNAAKFNVSAVWYEGDEVNKLKKLENTAALSVSKNYTIQLTIDSTQFLAGIDELNITLNRKKMEEILERKSKKVSLNVQILNDISVEFFVPMDGAPLAAAEEMTTGSDRFYVAPERWYDRINALPGEQLSDGTVAILGKKYYLPLTLQSAAKNQIFGGDTIKVNGKAYQVESRGVELGEDYVLTVLEFIATEPQVKISEDSYGRVVIKSPKAMNVTFAAALYNEGKLEELILKPNLALEKGEKVFFLVDESIGGSETGAKFLRRSTSQKVKITVLQSMSSLSPMCSAYHYKFRMS